MKRSPLRRRTPLTSGGRIKPRNAKRRQSEFARCYGSKERVAWIRAYPCVWCFSFPSDNAHTESAGMGYKAGYETIVPLCRSCHRRYDEYKYPFNSEPVRDGLKQFAARIERLWQRYLATREVA